MPLPEFTDYSLPPLFGKEIVDLECPSDISGKIIPKNRSAEALPGLDQSTISKKEKPKDSPESKLLGRPLNARDATMTGEAKHLQW